MDSMGGELTDTCEIFNRENLPVDPEVVPGLSNVISQLVDDDVDVRIRVSGYVNRVPEEAGPKESPFIPFMSDDGLVIGLSSLFYGEGDTADSVMGEMA